MNIVGIGMDLVDCPRIERLLETHGDVFAQRWFTEAERAYCELAPKQRVQRYAARFAAKEAVVKSLGTGVTQDITLAEIEVTRDGSGRPGIALHGRTLERANQIGVLAFQVSLTHLPDVAGATVVACGKLEDDS